MFRGLADCRFFVFGLAIVLMMIFRPRGLFPSKRRKAELLGESQGEQLYEASQRREPIAMALLEATKVAKNFGGLTALKDVNIDIQPGEIRGLIGPNGRARRLCSTSSPGSTRPRRARSSSTAKTSSPSSRWA